jgi:PadR family transcriptional regulator, regulatory protein PadR
MDMESDVESSRSSEIDSVSITIYPAQLKLEHEGWIVSEWGSLKINARPGTTSNTRSGRKQLAREEKAWNQTTAMVARFLTPVEDQL